jgi:hypothetical protein
LESFQPEAVALVMVLKQLGLGLSKLDQDPDLVINPDQYKKLIYPNLYLGAKQSADPEYC